MSCHCRALIALYAGAAALVRAACETGLGERDGLGDAAEGDGDSDGEGITSLRGDAAALVGDALEAIARGDSFGLVPPVETAAITPPAQHMKSRAPKTPSAIQSVRRDRLAGGGGPLEARG